MTAVLKWAASESPGHEVGPAGPRRQFLPKREAQGSLFLDPSLNRSNLGMGQNLTARGPAGLSPCFHLPGQAVLGLPDFDPQPSGQIRDERVWERDPC